MKSLETVISIFLYRNELIHLLKWSQSIQRIRVYLLLKSYSIDITSSRPCNLYSTSLTGSIRSNPESDRNSRAPNFKLNPGPLKSRSGVLPLREFSSSLHITHYPDIGQFLTLENL